MSGLDKKGSNSPHGIQVGGEILALSTIIKAVSISPASLATTLGATSSIAMPGVVLGKYQIEVIAPYSLQGISVNAYVSAADTIEIRLQNGTAGTIALATGIWVIQAIRVVI